MSLDGGKSAEKNLVHLFLQLLIACGQVVRVGRETCGIYFSCVLHRPAMERFGGSYQHGDRIMERMAFLNMRRLAIRSSKESVFGGDSQTVVDSSLTSLGWLQNLKVLDLFSPETKPSLSTDPPSVSEGEWEAVSTSDSIEEQSAPHIGISLSPIRKCLLQSAEFRRMPKKFRNSVEKPPYSYTTLIYLAIHHSKSEMVTLNEIYRWIKDNFKFYRTAEAAWQNSIRHNLSLNELFVKAPRPQGRGNHWKVNPDYEHVLSEGGEAFLLDYPKLKGKGRKRAHSMCCRDGSKGTTKNGRKRAKSVQTTPADPCGLPGDLDWVSLLSSQKVSCASCPSPEACRPVFGSPVLGPPDLGHIGDPVVCSPLTVPITTTAELPTTPASLGESKSALLEEAVLVQDSPSPNLLPWADSRMPSPATHPWAESKEMTLNGIRFLCKDKIRAPKSMWSPDSSWSLSYSSSGSSNGGLAAKRTALVTGAGTY